MNRFYYIKQDSTPHSGLVCLEMICRYYGRNIELTQVSPLAISLEDSIQEICNYAEGLGMNSIVGYLPLAKLSKVTLPSILYWKNEYYVVLYRIRYNKYFIANPMRRLVKYRESEIIKYWINPQITNEEKGVVIFIKPTEEFYKQAKAQNQLIKKMPLWGYIKHLLFLKKRIL